MNLTAADLRRYLKRVISFGALTLAILYLILDVLFLSLFWRCAEWIGRLPALASLSRWVARQHPYICLLLLAIPAAILEPAKPAGLYLMVTGRSLLGLFVIAGAEILKIVLIERLFQLTRPQLMSIPAFAWAFRHVMGWLHYLKSLRPYRVALRLVRRARARVKWAFRGAMRG